MPLITYSITAEATTDLEFAKISLEGKYLYLKPNSGRTKYTSGDREVDVDGLLNVFFKCKGFKNTIVTLTIINVTNDTQILNKKITIGKAPQPARIGKYDDNINP